MDVSVVLLTMEDGSKRRKTCIIIPLSIKNHIWNDIGLSLKLQIKRQATNL